MKTIYCIPDVDELMSAVIEELPHNRGEAYYALSMVLEMIESRRTEMLAMDPAEAEDEPPMYDCEDCCEECGEDEGEIRHFKMTIDAYGIDDLRAQMRDAYAHTFSAHLGDECIG